MSISERINLVLRVTMEAAIVIALSYWGFHTGNSASLKLILGIGAPLLGFGFWGLVDFHQAGALSEPLRLLQELFISGIAAVAWYAAGQHVLGWILGILSIVYHALVYITGGTLLKK